MAFQIWSQLTSTPITLFQNLSRLHNNNSSSFINNNNNDEEPTIENRDNDSIASLSK